MAFPVFDVCLAYKFNIINKFDYDDTDTHAAAKRDF